MLRPRGVCHAHDFPLRSGIVGSSAAAGSGTRRFARLAEGDAGESAFGHPRPGNPHGEAMPALRRRNGARRHDPAALRCHGRARILLLGMGHSGAGDVGASARAVSFHVPAQFPNAPFAREGQAALKFNSFWTIELEPGWSLFATHPVNRDDLPFRLISGLVDADRFHDGGINFPAIWTQPDFPAYCQRGRRWRNASRCRARRRSWSSKALMSRTKPLMPGQSPRCCPRRVSTESGFARAAGVQPHSAVE